MSILVREVRLRLTCMRRIETSEIARDLQMFTTKILRRLVCSSIVLSFSPTISRAEDVDVFLLIGALNMYGTETINNLYEPWLSIQSDVWMWKSPPSVWTGVSPGYGEGDSNSARAVMAAVLARNCRWGGRLRTQCPTNRSPW